MRAATGLLLALVAVIALGIAERLLRPVETAFAQQTKGSARQTAGAVLPQGEALNAINLSALSLADTVFAREGTIVHTGDTLGASITDPYRYLRADLLESLESPSPGHLLQGVAEDAAPEINKLGTDWERDLKQAIEELGSLRKRTQVRRTRTRYSEEDPEILQASVMGAEDAIRDLETKLRFLSPPTSDAARARALEITQQISVKRAYIVDAKRKIERTAPQNSFGEVVAGPALTETQRQRIRNLAAALRPDTNYILAPVNGRFVAPARNSVAQVRMLEPHPTGIGESTASLGATASAEDYAYRLEPVVTPVLWAKAKRVKAEASNQRSLGSALLVRPRALETDAIRMRKGPGKQ